MKKTVLYVAFNSAVNPINARSRFENLLVEHNGGFTRQDAVGGWRDDRDGSVFREESCIYTLHGLTDNTRLEISRWLARYTEERSILWEDAQGNGELEYLDALREELVLV